MAVSDSLYLALSEALSQPSKKYRAAQEGLAIPRKAMEGYEYGAEFMDKQNKRKQDQMTLQEILGGNIAGLEDLGNLTGGQVKTVAPLAPFIKARSVEKQKLPDTLEGILSQRVLSGEMSLDDAAKMKRSFSPSIYPKPEPGFRFGPSGELIPIPGGTPYEKRREEELRKEASRRESIDKANSLIKKIDTAISEIGPLTTGIGGALLKNVPATSAKNLNETLKTVKANIGFDTLQGLRESSKSGGALGPVSDRENELLQTARGSLDQKQSDDQLISNLKDLRKHYSNVILISESKTGDPEADSAIAQIISSEEPENKKRALISAVRSRAGR